MKNKKNIIIIILSIAVILLLSVVIYFVLSSNNSNKQNNIDGSEMTSSELKNMFEAEGYDFRITEFAGQKSTYIILENKKSGITVQRIINTLLGTLMTFDNDSINDEMADLITLSDNDTDGKKQQYKAFKSWLNYYNITQTQLSNMLDYYYSNNKSETEVINVNELINN